MTKDQRSGAAVPLDRVQRVAKAIGLHLAMVAHLGDGGGTLGQLGEHQVFFTGTLDLQELALEVLRTAERTLPGEPEVDIWNYPARRSD